MGVLLWILPFDKNVNIYYPITCQGISFETLEPNESENIFGKDYDILTAKNSGVIEAEVSFTYRVNDNEEKITDSFSFVVNP